MDIQDSENHERIVNVFLTKSELEGVIRRAIADKTGIPEETLRQHGKLEIEVNMEGSPQYRSGHRASLRAKISLTAMTSK